MPASECILCTTTDEVNRTGILGACERAYGIPCDLCKEHTDLDGELYIAKLAVERLLERRRSVRAKINQQHDILTTRLPGEIVYRIFELFLSRSWACGRSHALDEYGNREWKKGNTTVSGGLTAPVNHGVVLHGLHRHSGPLFEYVLLKADIFQLRNKWRSCLTG